MRLHPDDFTLGVEEEFQLVDVRSGGLTPAAGEVLAVAHERMGGQVAAELQRSEVETGTPICHGLQEVREELVRLRRELAAAAGTQGTRLASTGTHPTGRVESQSVTPEPRYLRMQEEYRQLVAEQLIAGCHVHVGIADPELQIQVLNRARPWLPVLLALSANSPFFAGTDTGYASYRTEVWSRWPTAGPPGVFADRAEYDRTVEQLITVGVIPDRRMVYWDIRPSARYATLEFRVADACLTVDETVMVAGLVRALARRCAEEALAGAALPRPRPELVRAAHWRAARSGLDGMLVDVLGGRTVPAAEQVGRFLEHIRPALHADGDEKEVEGLVERVLDEGTGAARQRSVFARRCELADVVDFIVGQTAA